MNRRDTNHPACFLALRIGLSALCLPVAMADDGQTAAAPRLALDYPAWVGAVAYDRHGKLLAAGTADGIARVLRAADGHETTTLRGHTDAVDTIAFVADGARVVTGSLDHTARIWDVATGQTQRVLRAHRGAVLSVAVDPGGTTVATAGIDAVINLWDLSTGQLRRALIGHKSWVNAVGFSPDGSWLGSASSDGTVRLWDTATGRLRTVLEARTPRRKTPAEVRSLAISPDGRIVAAGNRYGWIWLWSGARWGRMRRFQGHAAEVWALAFDRSGRCLASGDGDWNRPGRVKFWDAWEGQPRGELATSGEVLALACSPEGRRVAVGCWSQKLEVWDLPSALDSPAPAP